MLRGGRLLMKLLLRLHRELLTKEQLTNEPKRQEDTPRLNLLQQLQIELLQPLKGKLKNNALERRQIGKQQLTGLPHRKPRMIVGELNKLHRQLLRNEPLKKREDSKQLNKLHKLLRNEPLKKREDNRQLNKLHKLLRNEPLKRLEDSKQHNRQPNRQLNRQPKEQHRGQPKMPEDRNRLNVLLTNSEPSKKNNSDLSSNDCSR
jgi:hypothetical protein